MRGDGGLAWVEEEVDLAGEIALEAADDLELGVALGGLLREVGLGFRVQADAADDGECSARLACRSPPRLSLCRCVIPEEAGRGATPHSIAKAASDFIRLGLSPAVTSIWPATSTPMPTPLEQLWGEGFDEGVDELVEVGDLVGQFEVAAGHRFESDPAGGDRVGGVGHIGPPGREYPDELHTSEIADLVG